MEDILIIFDGLRTVSGHSQRGKGAKDTSRSLGDFARNHKALPGPVLPRDRRYIKVPVVHSWYGTQYELTLRKPW